MSSVETDAVEARVEQHPCVECNGLVEVTVLYRAKPKAGAPGELELVRGWTPPVVCDDCAEREALAASKARVRSPGRSLEDWLRDIGVNTRKHGHATIDNFDATDARIAPKAARQFVDETIFAGPHTRVGGLYLVGEGKGTGKTHLAVGIIRAVREARPDLGVVFDPADRLITRVQDSYGSGSTDDFIERRRNADVYVLDDLGREKGTEDALRTLCTILDEREGAPTVITSNLLPHQLGKRYPGPTWERVASRLGDGVYRYVEVAGRDRRFKEASS